MLALIGACIFLLRHYVEAINANVHAVDVYIFIRRLYHAHTFSLYVTGHFSHQGAASSSNLSKKYRESEL